MNEEKIIYLHIGLPKTGTTTIQKSLIEPENNKKLLDYGIYYPTEFGDNHIYFIEYFFGSPEATKIINRTNNYNASVLDNQYETQITNFKKNIEKNNWNKILFSNEFITAYSFKQLKNIKQTLLEITNNKYVIKPIIVMRNPVEWTKSFYQETVKAGQINKDISAFTKLHEVTNCINFCEDIFGADNIIFLNFDEIKNKKNGYLNSFLNAIDDKSQNYNLTEIIDNQTISGLAVDFKKYVNKYENFYYDNELKSFNYNLRVYALQKLKGYKYEIYYDEKLKIYDEYKNLISILKNKYNIEWEFNINISDDNKLKQTELEYWTNEDNYNNLLDFYNAQTNVTKKYFIEYLQTKQNKYPQNITLNNFVNKLKQNILESYTLIIDEDIDINKLVDTIKIIKKIKDVVGHNIFIKYSIKLEHQDISLISSTGAILVDTNIYTNTNIAEKADTMLVVNFNNSKCDITSYFKEKLLNNELKQKLEVANEINKKNDELKYKLEVAEEINKKNDELKYNLEEVIEINNKNYELIKRNNIELQKQIDNIFNSTSWKITKPIRYIKRKLKNIYDNAKNK